MPELLRLEKSAGFAWRPRFPGVAWRPSVRTRFCSRVGSFQAPREQVYKRVQFCARIVAAGKMIKLVFSIGGWGAVHVRWSREVFLTAAKATFLF